MNAIHSEQVTDHLTRVVTVKLEPGARYVVDNLLIGAGDTIAVGMRSIELKVTRSRKQGDSTIEQTVVETHSLPAMRYASPKALRYLVQAGQELEPGEVSILEYEVEDSFLNRVEKTIRRMTKHSSSLHVMGAIPDGKLQKAIAHYANSVDPDRVCFLFDDTVFGSAKDGFLITDSGFYYNNGARRLALRFREIDTIRVEPAAVKTGEKAADRSQLIVTNSDGEITVGDDWPGVPLADFESLLNLVIHAREIGQTKEVDGYVIVEDMPEPVRAAYLGLLVWLTYHNDGQIDERELSELQVLMTQLDCGPELRHQIRSYISAPSNLDPATLVKEMFAQTPSGSELALAGSLIKDAVRMVRSISKESALEQPGLRQLASLLNIDDQQIAFIEDACIQDEKIMAGELSDSQIMTTAKVMAAKASAVGVPIAAVYLSGSVTGLSAAGVTSGLASLGLGGILGFSSMVSGIGVALILGVGIYKGVRWLAGGKERDKASRRELMLQEVLRIHQKAISNLAEDVAFFGRRMVDLTTDVEKNKLLIGKLSRELSMFADAITRLRSKETGLESELKTELEKRAA
ncbi:hypothetical protein ACFSM5_07900 [Lacibacterium aquatile]|uniref:Uncharacterized protein n=1 Tax=Lacibacterium aquatile TaxID=1168082 RepID=A0ABW5DNV6_9PROT